MKRSVFVAVCLATALLLAPGALAQTGSVSLNGNSSLGSTSLSPSSAAPTSPGQLIRQQLRAEAIKFAPTFIDASFRDLRSALGMPAPDASSPPDFLDILETTLIDMLSVIFPS